MATRAPASETSSLNELVCACTVLDDWIHWMHGICGFDEGSESVPDDQAYLSSCRILKTLASNSSEFVYAFDYLVQLRSSVIHAINCWAPLLSRNEGQLPIQSTLLMRRPGTVFHNGKRSLRPPLLWFQFSSGMAYPTAHEAVCDCFDQFVTGFAGHLGPLSPLRKDEREILQLRTRDFVLQWCPSEAGRLLACMSQERRWLSRLLNSGPGGNDLYLELNDNYREKWSPYTSDTSSLKSRIQRLGDVKLKILDALLKREDELLTLSKLSKLVGVRVTTTTTTTVSKKGTRPNAKKPQEASPKDASPSRKIKTAITELTRENLIRPGGQGRGSKGYFLTPLGNAVALLRIRLRYR